MAMEALRQGGGARHDAFTHSEGYHKMRRMRAQVGRESPFSFQEREGDWFFVCNHKACLQTVAKVSKGGVGHTYTISELLTLAVRHMVECHAADLTYEHYGEDYA